MVRLGLRAACAGRSFDTRATRAAVREIGRRPCVFAGCMLCCWSQLAVQKSTERHQLLHKFRELPAVSTLAKDGQVAPWGQFRDLIREEMSLQPSLALAATSAAWISSSLHFPLECAQLTARSAALTAMHDTAALVSSTHCKSTAPFRI